MTKKELIKRIEEYKPKYIYQRYNGRICEYEVVNDNYLVDTKTGMSFDFRSHLMLGKVSENLIDLIECGDYVNGYIVRRTYLDGETHYIKLGEQITGNRTYNEDIKTVITREQFESISYKVTKM